MQTAKFVAFVLTVTAAFLTWILMGMAIFVQQADGVFWYGVAGIVFGVALKLELKFGWF